MLNWNDSSAFGFIPFSLSSLISGTIIIFVFASYSGNLVSRYCDQAVAGFLVNSLYNSSGVIPIVSLNFLESLFTTGFGKMFYQKLKTIIGLDSVLIENYGVTKKKLLKILNLKM